MLIFININGFGQLSYIQDTFTEQEAYYPDDFIVFWYQYSFPASPCEQDSVLFGHVNDSCVQVNAFYSIGDATMPCGNKDTVAFIAPATDNFTIILSVIGGDSLYVDSDTTSLEIIDSPPSPLIIHLYGLASVKEGYESDEEVEVLYHYSFATSPCSQDSVTFEFKNDSCIQVNAFYSAGDATMPCAGKDTISLGVLPAKEYSIIVNVIENESLTIASDTTAVKVIEATAPDISYITDLNLIQDEYTSDDSIFFKYRYHFPYQPCNRDSLQAEIKNDTCLYVDVYYSLGDAASPCAGTDSVGLNKLPADDYYIYFNLIAGDHVYTDSDTLFLSVKQGNTGINKSKLNSIQVYPNPALNKLYFPNRASLAIDAFSIYALNGQLIKSAKMDDSVQFVDISKIPVGMYVIKFYNEKSLTAVSRFIINR